MAGEKSRYLLGVDTGGTYTDAILLDYGARTVISSAKTLTTYEDLAVGVTKAIEKLEIESPEQVNLVGISSTLATNSVGEGKIRKTGLILVGYDRELVEGYGLDEQFSAHQVAYFQGGHNQQGEEEAALDLDGIRKWVEENRGKVEALAVSSYFSPLNPAHETAIEEELSSLCDLPLVLGHQLSTKLDSIKRAATASLNASLVAVMHEFIEAVHRALEKSGISAPLMVVKGDGSLMTHEEAAHKPVETVLSGPAASSIGGRFLARRNNALVIDMGGTTTDMALLQEGQVTVSEDGATVGPVKTAVKAAEIRTAVIGCDSRIAVGADNKVTVGPERVVPLCRLATEAPVVLESLESRNRKRGYVWKASDLVFWFLRGEFEEDKFNELTKAQQTVVRFISETPKCLTDILSEANVHHEVQLNADVLFSSGHIGVATLTPTDLLHARKYMSKWSEKAASIAVKRMADIASREPKQLMRETIDQVVEKIVEEAIVFLAREHAELPESIDGEWGQWLFNECLEPQNDLLEVSISSRLPIIGIGAPAPYFIKKVAKGLKTRFLAPEHAEVANAVGAVVGMNITEEEAIVHVRESGDDTRNYIVQVNGENLTFKEEEEAYIQARKLVAELAEQKCIASGVDTPQLNMTEKSEGHLQRIIARAAGNIALS
ncbi:MAG: hydantoinase/oxoprolinase N-terminal domain-containing protein [Verrucomicrobiota bacterium]